MNKRHTGMEQYEDEPFLGELTLQ